jgi:hypothetical protein
MANRDKQQEARVCPEIYAPLQGGIRNLQLLLTPQVAESLSPPFYFYHLRNPHFFLISDDLCKRANGHPSAH